MMMPLAAASASAATSGPASALAALDLGYGSWSWWTWTLYALAALYTLGFFVYWFRFRAAERKAKTGEAGAVARYNRMLRGFPNGFYAKNFGKRKLDVERKEG